MEQNSKYQQELQYQGFQQTDIDFETPYEAEQRYERFMQVEMNRQALLPKYLESKASVSRLSKRSTSNFDPNMSIFRAWTFYCILAIFILMVGVITLSIISNKNYQ